MMSTLGPIRDPKSYSFYGLYVAGKQFTDDCGQVDAIEQHLELHLGAHPAAVRQEFADEVAKYC